MILSRTLTLALLAAAPAFADAAKDGEAIRKLFADHDVGWNKNDAKIRGAIYADDANVINAYGQIAKGKAEVEKAYAAVLNGPLKGSTHVVTVSSIRPLGDDLAFVDLDALLGNLKGPDGKSVPDQSVHGAFVLARKDGKWLVKEGRLYGYAPLPAPPAAPPNK